MTIQYGLTLRRLPNRVSGVPDEINESEEARAELTQSALKTELVAHGLAILPKGRLKVP